MKLRYLALPGGVLYCLWMGVRSIKNCGDLVGSDVWGMK